VESSITLNCFGHDGQLHEYFAKLEQAMKAFRLFVVILAATFSLQAATTSLETFSPHFSTNTEIIWQASTNNLPVNFWIYKRLPPHPFSAAVISNAVILASLERKIAPEPSTNDFFLPEDHPSNYPGMIPVIFSITPKSATISYGLPHPDTNTIGIPADKALVQRAWACAVQFGVNPAQIAFKEMTSRYNQDENYNDLTNQLIGRGVFLSRKLDGVLFTDIGDQGANGGFWIEFGSHGQVHAFSLVWPELQRDKLQPTANAQQIITCIRAFKTMSLPIHEEADYFARLKNFAKAKKLTITKIKPYYMEGIYGGMPTNDEPSEFIATFAELEAVADFGNSNATVRLLSPILSSEVSRLLENKIK
jgi:hypothetical protein